MSVAVNGIVQDTVGGKGDVDGGKMNVLAFVFRGCGLQRIDLLHHERETRRETRERTFMNISS